jgi:hypothetical protein
VTTMMMVLWPSWQRLNHPEFPKRPLELLE